MHLWLMAASELKYPNARKTPVEPALAELFVRLNDEEKPFEFVEFRPGKLFDSKR